MEVLAETSVTRLIYQLRRAKKRRATVSWSVPVEVALMVLDPGHLSKTRFQGFGFGYASATPDPVPVLGQFVPRADDEFFPAVGQADDDLDARIAGSPAPSLFR
eukprot:932638-Pyramimonas_sp.AAC.1